MTYGDYHISTCQDAARAWCCFLGDPLADIANSLPRRESIGSISMRPRKRKQLQPAATGQEQSRVTCSYSRRIRHADLPKTDRTRMHACLAFFPLVLSRLSLASELRLHLCQPTSSKGSAPLARGLDSKIQPSATRFLPACLLCCARFVRRADNNLLVCFRTGWSGERWARVGTRL